MTELEVLIEKVKRGAALLDCEQPGWRAKIDINKLDLSIGCDCILGQVFGHYDNGVQALWDFDLDGCHDDEWLASPDYRVIINHGFTIVYTGDNERDEYSWIGLQEAWIVVLEKEMRCQ